MARLHHIGVWHLAMSSGNGLSSGKELFGRAMRGWVLRLVSRTAS